MTLLVGKISSISQRLNNVPLCQSFLSGAPTPTTHDGVFSAAVFAHADGLTELRHSTSDARIDAFAERATSSLDRCFSWSNALSRRTELLYSRGQLQCSRRRRRHRRCLEQLVINYRRECVRWRTKEKALQEKSERRARNSAHARLNSVVTLRRAVTVVSISLDTQT